MTSPSRSTAGDDFDDFEAGQAEDDFGEFDDPSAEGGRPRSADHGMVHVSEGASWTTSDSSVGVSVGKPLDQASEPNGRRSTMIEHGRGPDQPITYIFAR